jgi:DNA replication licensing factor MCM5
MKCIPKLSQEAGELLQNYYVADRKEMKDKKKSKSRNNIPVTVRQLEAIIRLSEAIAKMSLSNIVLESHVNEAHRLFRTSTMQAASSGLSITGEIPSDLVPTVLKVEEAIRRRMAIGTKVSYTKLTEDFSTKYPNRAIEYV